MSNFTEQRHAAPPHARNLRVLLADASPAPLSRLREALQPLPFIEIVGEARHGRETLDLLFRLRPGAIVLSASLPDQGGFELLRCIKRLVPDCAVILTCRWPTAFVKEAGGLLGAAAVCSTDGQLDELGGLLRSLSAEPGSEA
jgi:DNA-binding NarL/FixJ family response regulator